MRLAAAIKFFSEVKSTVPKSLKFLTAALTPECFPTAARRSGNSEETVYELKDLCGM
jgi:hypothetical protein